MRFKFSISPLFFAFFIYYIATRRTIEFILCTITAVIHEIAHAFVADNLGYKLNRIILMPFGAVVKGNIDGLKLKDEFIIALSAPLLNLAIALFFIAIWWIFPQVYAFTDAIVYTNLSMAVINFIPAYPLDGGRIFYSVVALKRGKKIAGTLCKIHGIILASILLLAFVFTAIYKSINLSLLFFSLFVVSGVFIKDEKVVYQRVIGGVTESKLNRGMPILSQAVSYDMPIRKVMRILEPDAVNEIRVYKNGKQIRTLTQNEINSVLENAEMYQTIGDCLT